MQKLKSIFKLRYLIAIIAVILIILIIRSCNKKSDVVYTYDKVTRGEVKKTISVTGELGILDAVTVLSKAGGVVENIYVGFNQHVSKGSLLVKLDPSAIEQRLLKLEVAMESAKLEIKSAERSLEDKKNLYKDNLISKRAMEQAELEYNSVLNRFKQTKLDYEQALIDRNNTRVYSPIDGMVINIFVGVGSPVGVSTPLVLLAPNLKRMFLTINIDESDIGIVRKGQEVLFTVSAFPERKFKGVIEEVRMNPIKTGGLVTYQSIVVCDNDELLLKPGMTATATVVIDQKADVLRVSNQAFIISPEDPGNIPEGKKILWVKAGITAGKLYKRREVKVGLVGDMYTEIIDGLKENEEVLVKIHEKK
ncbi:MAG TPA: efflux RND transporter periplasmic adaptor subunit [Spirochaetota bacterium]|nr:efflux RND transporter periplasmic adaptor subunit [Spirochaetota bacterium]